MKRLGFRATTLLGIEHSTKQHQILHASVRVTMISKPILILLQPREAKSPQYHLPFSLSLSLSFALLFHTCSWKSNHMKPFVKDCNVRIGRAQETRRNPSDLLVSVVPNTVTLMSLPPRLRSREREKDEASAGDSNSWCMLADKGNGAKLCL